MTDTSQRDELVALLEGHEIRANRNVGCSCGWWAHEHEGRSAHAAHLADVLLAAGWSKADEAEVEWGVRYEDGTIDQMVGRVAAENTIEFRGKADLPGTLMTRTRTVGPWQEAE